ncbi:MAG: ATP-binding cassette domain-containing protein, partial [Pseudomonadota bacterium]|nr:ATP-binding cassette domain-containing protein [Pseudomonadota bacterium]
IAPAHVDSPFHFQFPAPNKMPALLIHLDEVSVGYQQLVLERVKLRITPGSRIGLLGPNGAGKSTLIKLLAGILSPLKGQYTLGEEVQIGYFAQHQLEQLRPEASPLHHLQHLDAQSSEQSLRNFLGGFGFAGDKALSPVAPFSGGERARLALALLIWQQPQVLLLDEPTNHLDLEMRHALTLALQDYQGALIIVSHDRHLLRTTTDELLLVAQQRVNVFTGDLADYRQWLLEHRAQQRQAPVPEKKRQHYQQRKPLQNRLKQLEKDLDRLSAEKNTLETLLADPQIYTDKEKVQSYIHQQTQLAQQLQRTEELWLEVTEALETLQAT